MWISMPECKLCGKDVPHRKLKHLNEVHKLGLARRGYKIEDYFETVSKPNLTNRGKSIGPNEQQDVQQVAEETGHQTVTPSKKKLKVMHEDPKDSV